MKIAFVIINANRREGTARAVLEVAERLADRHDVHLLARTVEDLKSSKIQWRRISGPGWPEVCDLWTFVAGADRLLRRERFDIVHSAGPNTTVADVYAVQTIHPAKTRVMETVGFYSQAHPLRRFSRRLYDRAVVSLERRAYRARGVRGALAFLPVASGVYRELCAEYPVDEAYVDVLPNGVDLEQFHPRYKEMGGRTVRRAFGIAENDFVVIFSGGDWQRKGLAIAVEAIGRVNDPHVKLLVAGDDPLADQLRAQWQPWLRCGRVAFAGFQREVRDFYAAGDIMAFPTAYEAFSLATIEAAASGLPVLMPDVSGAAELVGSGEAGMIVPRDAGAYAAQIARLASNRDACKRLGESARAYVAARYGWDAIAQTTERTYQRLLEKRGEQRLEQGAGVPAGAA